MNWIKVIEELRAGAAAWEHSAGRDNHEGRRWATSGAGKVLSGIAEALAAGVEDEDRR